MECQNEETPISDIQCMFKNIPSFPGLSTIDLHERQAVVYIAGYVCRKATSRYHCEACSIQIHNGKQFTNVKQNDIFTYLSSVSRGGLLIPTDFMVLIIAYCQHVFKSVTTDVSFLKGSNQRDILTELLTKYICCYCKPFHCISTRAICISVFANLSLNRFSRESTLSVASRKSRKLSTFQEE